MLFIATCRILKKCIKSPLFSGVKKLTRNETKKIAEIMFISCYSIKITTMGIIIVSGCVGC